MRKVEKKKKYSRSCTVSNPQTHPDGYTLYTVILKVVPEDTCEEEYEIKIYKRYNDFKSLYHVLSDLHSKLQRPSKFPELAKPQLFGRFDGNVIKERQTTSETVLNFCAQHFHLYNHAVFKNFFEGGVRHYPFRALQNPTLKPKPAEHQDDIDILLPSLSLMTNDLPDTEIEPIIRLPDVPKDFEEEGEEGEEGDEGDDEYDEAIGTALPEADITNFDPFAVRRQSSHDEVNNLSAQLVSRTDSTSANESNSWLLSAMTACSELNISPSASFNTSEDAPAAVPEPLEIDVNARTPLQSPSHCDPMPSPLDLDQYSRCTAVGAAEGRSFFSNFRNINNSANSTSHQEDYIVRAARYISAAQTHEAECRYEAAFNAYKSGVAILLQGVQSDQDRCRREMVRRKTGQYLLRAETLYNKHLAVAQPIEGTMSDPDRLTEDTTDRWAMNSADFLSCALSIPPQAAALQSPASDLRNYRVLGTVGRITLVLHNETQKSFALKSIFKCDSLSSFQKAIVPVRVPFMVQLHRIFETEDVIYLLLEFASGGLLFDYVREFVPGFSEDVPVYAPELDYAGNVYSGKVIEGKSAAPSPPPPVQLSDDEEELQHFRDSSVRDTSSPIHLHNSNSIAFLSEDSSGGGSVNAPDADGDGDSNRFQEILQTARGTQELFSIASCDSDNTSFDRQHSEEPVAEDSADLNLPLFEPIPEEGTTTDPSSSSTAVRALFADSAEGSAGADPSLPPFEHIPEEGTTTDPGSSSTAVRALPMNSAEEYRPRQLSEVFAPLVQSTGAASSTAAGAPVSAPVGRSLIPELCVRQWAAEMVLSLRTLHTQGIICSDLSPRNVLLCSRGHIRLTYFSQWPNATHKPDMESVYVAPEQRLPGYRAVASADWWSLGVLLTELLLGSPLPQLFPAGLSRHSVLKMPDTLSAEAADLCRRLLCYEPAERLGGGRGCNTDGDELLHHPFFAGVDWTVLEREWGESEL